MIAAVHKDGTLTRFAMPSGTPATPVASMFMNARFNSPNDLAIRSDGNIYFSDPNHQAPNTPPQSATRAYRVAPGGAITPIPNEQSPDQLGNPNGITLSLNEDFLYVAAAVGRRYPVMADGSLGAGTDFPAISSGDGMVVDCAGNLYVARDQSVSVYTGRHQHRLDPRAGSAVGHQRRLRRRGSPDALHHRPRKPKGPVHVPVEPAGQAVLRVAFDAVHRV
jgi:gluconolactonase